MSVTLRPATLADAETITALVHAAWKDDIDPRSSGHRLTVEGARQNLEAGGGFIGEDDGVALGCVCYWNDGSTLDLMKLAVHPNARGRGLALQLVRAVEAHAARAGFERILLAVSLYNLSVIPFYERLGYVLDDSAEYKHASASSPAPRVMVKGIMISGSDGRLDEIKMKLTLLRQLDSNCQLFGAKVHRYELSPPLTPQTLRDLEGRLGANLPVEYTVFLRRVGNGGAGPGYGLLSLEEAIQKSAGRDFKTPFPHDTSWQPLFGNFDYSELSKVGELDAYMNTPIDSDNADYVNWRGAYNSHLHVGGSLFISTDGCGHETLLVISGPEQGNMWLDSRVADAGIVPLEHRHSRIGFLDWYEQWLDQGLRQAKRTA